MKTLFKSKLGFTLIELLVVIGILAVLAAIAIPSVAGLIDRANVSADATNANEMTNAVERFVSEYELYVQDISSGRLDTENLDAAQGRVKNVTNVIDRTGIETLEKDATAGVNTTGRAIYRDTKYPVNVETMQAVVENYMKTSSTTFTPKQSDCHFYYSPDCGIVVCTETAKSSVTDLNSLIQSGKDAKGNPLGTETKWIDLTANISANNNSTPTESPVHNDIIPVGGEYISDMDVCTSCLNNYIGAFHGATGESCENCGYVFTKGTRYTEGEAFPEIQKGDVYKYGDFEYCYGYSHCACGYTWSNYCDYCSSYGSTYQSVGWAVKCMKNIEKPGIILETINNQPITSMNWTFTGCYNLITSPQIPSTVTDMEATFTGCSKLTATPILPDGITVLNYTFHSCSSIQTISNFPSSLESISSAFASCSRLTTIPSFPSSLKNLSGAFEGCSSLTTIPTIPNNVTDLSAAFQYCTSLTTVSTIPSSVMYASYAFNDCTSLTGTIEINTNTNDYDKMFNNVNFQSQNLKFSGSSNNLDAIGNTGGLYCSECNGYCNDNASNSIQYNVLYKSKESTNTQMDGYVFYENGKMQYTYYAEEYFGTEWQYYDTEYFAIMHGNLYTFSDDWNNYGTYLVESNFLNSGNYIVSDIIPS